MTAPTGRVVNVPVQSVSGSVTAELVMNGAKVCAANPLPVTGGTGGGGSGGAVTVANGADIATGSTLDAEATGNGSVIAILKRIRTLLSGTLAVSVGNFPATQPVSGTVSTGLTQPLTDTQLRATAVPVSGAFYLATQPVSGTVALSNPPASPETGLAKDATFAKDVDGGIKMHVQNFPATQPVSGSVAVTNFPATQPVSIAATVPVSGTFWQATQPVSIAATVTTADSRLPSALNGDGGLPVHVQNFATSQPVTGTFWQATQPVSGTVTANTGLTQPLTDTQLRAAAVPVSLATAPVTPVTGTFWQATQPVSLATNTPDITDRAGRLLGVVTQQQAARTAVVLSVTAVTSIVTETVLSLNQFRAGAASTITSYTVPVGKTFRLQSIQFGVRFSTPSTTVTFGTARFNLRAGTLVTSPLIFGDSKLAAANMPTPNSDLSVPDGLDFAAGTVLSLWQACSAVTMSLDALIVGYEY